MEQESDGMSVIVKSMEMPQNCGECALYIDGACYGKGYRDYRSIMDTAKPDDCPLIELPPHGRLADLDKMINDFWDCDSMIIGNYELEKIKTVIEAEGET